MSANTNQKAPERSAIAGMMTPEALNAAGGCVAKGVLFMLVGDASCTLYMGTGDGYAALGTATSVLASVLLNIGQVPVGTATPVDAPSGLPFYLQVTGEVPTSRKSLWMWCPGGSDQGGNILPAQWININSMIEFPPLSLTISDFSPALLQQIWVMLSADASCAATATSPGLVTLSQVETLAVEALCDVPVATPAQVANLTGASPVLIKVDDGNGGLTFAQIAAEDLPASSGGTTGGGTTPASFAGSIVQSIRLTDTGSDSAQVQLPALTTGTAWFVTQVMTSTNGGSPRVNGGGIEAPGTVFSHTVSSGDTAYIGLMAHEVT